MPQLNLIIFGRNKSMDKVDDYIWKQNIIPKKLCHKTVKEISKTKWITHLWYNNEKGNLDSERTRESQMQPGNQVQQNTFAPYLIKALNEYQRTYSVYGGRSGVNWLNNLSVLKFNKYEKGSMMRKHYDHILDIFDGKKKGVPILSIIVQLNDGYKGAQFCLREKEIPLKAGDVLFFPSNFMYPHEVKEITKGVRYSIACWAW